MTLPQQEQDARTALLNTYSSQLISHGAQVVSMILITLVLVQIKSRFIGILSIFWWLLFWVFASGSIFLMGRLVYYGKLSNLVLHCELDRTQETTILHSLRKGISNEFDSLSEKRWDYKLIKFFFVKKLRWWILSALILGILSGTLGFIYNWNVIVKYITSLIK